MFISKKIDLQKNQNAQKNISLKPKKDIPIF